MARRKAQPPDVATEAVEGFKRLRDFAAEYARRLLRENERAAREGRPFSRTKARGHGTPERERERRRARAATRTPEQRASARDRAAARRIYDRQLRDGGEAPTPWEELKAVAKRRGWSDTRKLLAEQEQHQKSYRRGRRPPADWWEASDHDDIPDTLFHYH